MTGYLLDANVFIEAKNRHYGFDFCPAFWDWLVAQNQAGKVASVEKVADELRVGKDDLAGWVVAQGNAFFLNPDDAVVTALGTVSDWANDPNNDYQQSAINVFLSTADSWLIAHALAQRRTVVTHEVFAKTIAKIKIPNVCRGLGLDCINPYKMLRREQARFILRLSRENA